MVLVNVQLSVLGLYLPPVFKKLLIPSPPQAIIALPVQTAVGMDRRPGALVLLVAGQLATGGWSLPPVFKGLLHLHRPRRSSHCRSRPPCDRLAPRVR